MEKLKVEYKKGNHICYSRKKGTHNWRECKYPKWFDVHEYKLESKVKKVEHLNCQESKEQWEDQFAKLDRASL